MDFYGVWMHECMNATYGNANMVNTNMVSTNMVNTNMVSTNMGTNMGSKIRRHEHGVKEPIMG